MFDYTSRKRKVGLVWAVFRKPGQGLRRTFSSILAICLVLVQVLSVLMGNFAIPAYAASSPWSQTDWSGGSGQTAWSVTNKYSSGSSVTTSTPNQVTLAQTSNWYNSSWTYRKKITLDNTASSSTLTNFPVLISLSSSNFTFSKAQSAGQDIRFTDSDGTTALSYQIEKWDNLNSQAWIWVKVPSLTATNYTIHMYYGNASASDGQSATSVWDSNTAAVWHLKELGNGTSGEYKDSTSNANNGQGGGGTSLAVPTLVSSGEVDGAQSFDGINSYISVGNSSSLQPLSGSWTVSFWMKRLGSGAGDFPQIIGSRPWNAALDKGWALGLDSVSNVICSHYADGSTGFDLNTGSTCSNATSTLNTFEHWTVVFDRGSSRLKYYKSGALDVNDNPNGGGFGFPSGSINQADAINIGRDISGSNNRRLNAVLDEVRISNVARSADWVAASYKSESNTIASFAAEEPQMPPSGTLTSSIFDSGQISNWGTLTYAATVPSNTALSVKVRSGNSADLSDATAFSSCSTISSGSSMSANACVPDNSRYAQYQLSLSDTDSVSTPSFTSITIPFSAAIPAAPSSFSGAAVGTSAIDWTWTDNASNESGFYVQDNSNNTTCTVAAAASGTGGTVTCTETGLSASTSYTRHVVAYNSAGTSAASNSASATTTAAPVPPASPPSSPTSSSGSSGSGTSGKSSITHRTTTGAFSRGSPAQVTPSSSPEKTNEPLKQTEKPKSPSNSGPAETPKPNGPGNALTGIFDAIGNLFSWISNIFIDIGRGVRISFNTVGSGMAWAGEGIGHGFGWPRNGFANLSFVVGEKTDSFSNAVGDGIVQFGYRFTTEPTTISNVKVVKLTGTSAVITWKTNHPATGKVNYGVTEDFGQDVQSTKRVTEHEFTITHLAPNTAYFYEVMSQSKDYIYDAKHEFRTSN